MKPIALYLPQFHTFPENDRWWGEGYTEWTAVRRAKPLIKGQIQPRIPLGLDYYDLSDEGATALKRQAKHAKNFGIYGFCFYHYYFTGTILMKRPMEIFLQHPEIDMKYCICWANESWTRTWYGLEEEVLMQQRYGHDREWSRHFNYLLHFFKDDRYIRIDNKPVLNIYRAQDIKRLSDMLELFNNKARKEGFDGIYTICAKTAAGIEDRGDIINGHYYFEPGYTLKQDMGFINSTLYRAGTGLRYLANRTLKKEHLERRIPIELIYDRIAKREYAENEYPGIFARWDNTPRRGYKGLVYTGASPSAFEEILGVLDEKMQGRENDFVYINSWNEWGEGAMLEPDEKERFDYLEAVKRVVNR